MPVDAADAPGELDVAVVGAGPIGLASAWRLAAEHADLRIGVFDAHPGGGAADVAAGMLAPVTEVVYGEDVHARLGLASSRLWPAFADELELTSGIDLDHGRQGTLVVAYDGDDKAVLDDLFAYQTKLSLPARMLRSREVRSLEPLVAPSIRGGMLAEGDHHVDPRALCRALVVACERAGVTVVAANVRSLSTPVDTDAPVNGVVTSDGTPVRASVVVLAAGVWSSSIEGLPDLARAALRPVKGQIVTLRGPADRPLLHRPVRGLVKGSSIYVVPRRDGRLVIGATMEEKGWDAEPTAGGVYELLRDASLLVPGISELAIDEVRAGLRPTTPDNAPIIGRCPHVDGLVYAIGHHRNGILLTPVTAEAVVGAVTGRPAAVELEAFRPDRFEAVEHKT